jgi:hypothetical protein
MNFPVFYITSTEASPTIYPRKCKIIKSLWSTERQTHFFLIGIDKPIKLNFSEEITEIVIAPRHNGVNIIKELKTHPFVFICFIKNYENIKKGMVDAKDLNLFIIGEIYETEAEAEKDIKGIQQRI